MFHSSNLEIHLVNHCNLDCIGCSHESPLLPKWIEDADMLKQSLEKLWSFYQSSLIKFLGGEPLLHPEINQLIEITKQITNAKIRVVTNGSLLMKYFIRLKGVDEIHVSVYPGIEIPSDKQLSTIASNLSVPITLQKFDNFRWHRSLRRDDKISTKRIFNSCQLYNRWECHTLRNGWFYPCPPLATWSNVQPEEGINLCSAHTDVESSLDRILNMKEPFKTCHECLGSAGKLFPHQRGWRKLSNVKRHGDIDYAFLNALEKNPDAYNSCYKYERVVHPNGRVEAIDESGK